jgi:hypothetical protein
MYSVINKSKTASFFKTSLVISITVEIWTPVFMAISTQSHLRNVLMTCETFLLKCPIYITHAKGKISECYRRWYTVPNVSITFFHLLDWLHKCVNNILKKCMYKLHVQPICTNCMYKLNYKLHVQSACTSYMYKQNVQSACTICMYKLHVQTACSNCMDNLPVQSACKICIYKLHVQTACTICMYNLHIQSTCTKCMYKMHVQTTYTNCMYKLHVQSSCIF